MDSNHKRIVRGARHYVLDDGTLQPPLEAIYRHPVISDLCQTMGNLGNSLARRGDLYPPEVVEWLLGLTWREILQIEAEAQPTPDDGPLSPFPSWDWYQRRFAERVILMHWTATNIGGRP